MSRKKDLRKSSPKMGGAREGAGRKTDDKKEQVTLYIPGSFIKKVGKIKEFKQFCYKIIALNISKL